MKYVIAVIPEREPTEEEVRFGMCGPVHTTEESAIKEASKMSRGKNVSVGIYKIVKQVDPPNVNIKDVE